MTLIHGIYLKALCMESSVIVEVWTQQLNIYAFVSSESCGMLVTTRSWYL